MAPETDISIKPRSDQFRPEITRLPELTRRRLAFRKLLRFLLRILVRIATRTELTGLENFPRQGPALMVLNHLGDADGILGFALAPAPFETVAKAELYDFPVLGKVLEWYGVIWIHRGRADRPALRAILAGLKEGKVVGIAPEGRESLSGSLEEGTHGAAYLAMKSGAPLIPVAFTGTENWRVFGNLRRLRRTSITIKIGKAFFLEQYPDRRLTMQLGTQQIMENIARLLPAEYRGLYSDVKSDQKQ